MEPSSVQYAMQVRIQMYRVYNAAIYIFMLYHRRASRVKPKGDMSGKQCVQL